MNWIIKWLCTNQINLNFPFEISDANYSGAYLQLEQKQKLGVFLYKNDNDCEVGIL